MKRFKLFFHFVAAAAIAMSVALFSTAAYAQTDLSGFNGGLTKLVSCTNVPAQSGSVGGFRVQNIGWFVQEPAAHLATVDAYVIPAEFHPKDADEVVAYLQSVGLTNFALDISRGQDVRIVDGEPVTVSDVSKWCF
jgi:hypothetical protein